ncbi:Uncharacterized protein HZ326_31099 [Fusarium oxysporum f. sp. albedinis]|nr:Uncharacterized protein HZ326_31099 [Fusarium oxysporum f. sp. albedinis]
MASTIITTNEALNAYDDSSFINEDNSRQEHSGDSTRRPAFPAADDRGFNFHPFEVPRRELLVNELPQSPLSLFQHFIPMSIVKEWVKYTNDWVTSLIQRGVVDSQEHEMTEKSRLNAWKPTTIAEMYIWLVSDIKLGILIYMGVHNEITVEDYWKTSRLENQRPEHSIIKFMTYDRFQIIYRHVRVFDHTEFANGYGNLPTVFQCVESWSQHLQQATTELGEPGTHLAVDEAMIRYTGRNKQVTRVPNKPVDTGFKVWIAAQLGIFMRCIWHQPGARYGPVEDVIYVATEAEAKIVALNSTQSVVVALINLLPISTYHVFVDNLFSSPDLFRSLRQHGHGATGTARSNCGIYNGLVEAKKADKAGKSGFQFNEIKVIPTADNQVNQVAWKDNALVLFLSTVFAGDERTERWRRRPSTKTPTARPIRRFFGSEPAKLISILLNVGGFTLNFRIKVQD